MTTPSTILLVFVSIGAVVSSVTTGACALAAFSRLRSLQAATFTLLATTGALVYILFGLVGFISGGWKFAPVILPATAIVGAVLLVRGGIWFALIPGTAFTCALAASYAIVFATGLANLPTSSGFFWGVYDFTGVTPGDAPIGYYQAQYIMHHWDPRSPLHAFSFGDRPIGAGLITATVLASLGQGPVPPGEPVPFLQEITYAGLWIGLNAIGLTALIQLAGSLLDPRRTLVLAGALVLSPYLGIMCIGLWPKMLAIAFSVASVLLLPHGRLVFSALMAGTAFYIHGSFFAFAVITGLLLTIYVTFSKTQERPDGIGALGVLGFCALSMAVIATWFILIRYMGIDSPLKYYYLYNAGVDELLQKPASEIKRAFYLSTTSHQFAGLGLVNFIRALLPSYSILTLPGFVLGSPTFQISTVFDGIMLTYWRNPLFAFGFVNFCVVIHALVRAWRSNWIVPVSALVILLGFCPGFLLYHRDYYPSLHVMMYAVIPLTALTAIGLSCFSRTGLRTYIVLSALEAASVWLLRSHAPWQKPFPAEFPYLQSWLFIGTLSALVIGATASTIWLVSDRSSLRAEDPGPVDR